VAGTAAIAQGDGGSVLLEAHLLRAAGEIIADENAARSSCSAPGAAAASLMKSRVASQRRRRGLSGLMQ